MSLETGTFISDLIATNPTGSDDRSTADDHLRLIKSTLLATFPNITGAVTPTHTELNYVDGVTSAIQTQINSKAPLASPALTGTPTINGANALYFDYSNPRFTSAIRINDVAGTSRTLSLQTSGVLRWSMYANNTAESGGNAGSDFNLVAYDDVGSALGSALSISRATRVVNFPITPTIAGSNIIGSGITSNQSVQSGGGNFGIGTAAPVAKLHVSGSGVVSSVLESTTGRASFAMRYAGATIGGFNSASGYLQIGYGASFDSNIAMSIDSSNGYVGIGDTAPSDLLSLKKSGVCGLSMESTTYPRKWTSYVDGSTGALIVSDTTGTRYPFKLYPGAANNSLVVDSSGQIGIGTTTPSSELMVGQDGGGSSNYITIGKGFDSSSGINWQRSGIVDASIQLNDGENLLFEIDKTNALSSNAFRWNANGGTIATLTDSGNLGLGTTSPSSELHINSADPELRLSDSASANQRMLVTENSGTGTISSGNNGSYGVLNFNQWNGTSEVNRQQFAAAGDIIFKNQAGSEKARLDSSGNLGIGIAAPTYKLHVVGDTYVSTTLSVGTRIFSKDVATNWINFNGTGTIAIRDSFGVSSITDLGVGHYDITYSVVKSTTNYASFNGSADATTIIGCLWIKGHNLTKLSVQLYDDSSVATDFPYCDFVVYGG